MADTKISAMTPASTLTGNENVPLVQSGTNVQTTTGNLVSQILDVTPVSPEQGGTNLTTYTLGDTIYASATNTLSKLAGNTTTTNKFLTQTGTGSASAAPVWKVLVPSDINTQYGSFYFDSITSLTDGISQNSTADIVVGSTTGFSTAGQLLCEQEIITYTGKTSTTFTGITRGTFGSSSSAHTAGTAISGAQGGDALAANTVIINATSLSNGVTLDTGTNELVFAVAGTYNVQFSAQFFNGASGDDNSIIWYRVNDVDVAASTSLITTSGKHAGGNGASIMTVNLFLDLNANDRVKLMWSAKGGNSVIATYQPLPTGGSPYSPGIIVTANQVS